MSATDVTVVPMALPLRTLAPAKINLGLFVGPTRADGKHELVSVMQPVSLADELTLEGAADGDEVVCPGIEGENLAARAIELFRQATGWQERPLRGVRPRARPSAPWAPPPPK